MKPILFAIMSIGLIIGILTACVGQRLAFVPMNTPFPDFLDTSVDIGGHLLPIQCIGSGEPTIILENGLGSFVNDSSWTDHDLFRFNKISRTCRYLRVGGNGEELTQTRTTEDQVKDLHDLLTKAGVPKPYILVGHSIAGLNMVLYTSHYPDEVVGIVCVDCRPPSYDDASDFSGGNIEGLDGIASHAQAQKVTTLGDLPFIVLVAYTSSKYPDWMSASETLSKLSTRGKVQVVSGDHKTILPNIDVDNAIKEVFQTSKK
jgi:pimeloyl-ACP methyl ester carboxylesterase